MKNSRFFWIMAVLLGLLGVAALVVIWQAIAGMGSARVVVEWSTASELDTAGFNLYRSESPDGPFEKVNQNLISGAT